MKSFIACAIAITALVSLPTLGESISAHQGGVWKIKFSTDGLFFLTAGGDGKARMWWTDCLCPLTTFEHDSKSILTDAAFLPDGNVLSASRDGSFYSWFRETGKVVKKITGHTEYLTRIRVSADGSFFYTTGTDSKVRRYKTEGFEVQSSLATKTPIGIAVHEKDPFRLLTVGLAGMLFWSSDKTEPTKQLSESPYFFTAENYDDNSVFVIGSTKQGGPPHFVSWETGEKTQEFEHKGGAYWQIAISPNKQWIAGARHKGSVVVWDASTGKIIYETPAELGEALSVDFFPEGQALLVGFFDGTAKVIRF